MSGHKRLDISEELDEAPLTQGEIEDIDHADEPEPQKVMTNTVRDLKNARVKILYCIS